MSCCPLSRGIAINSVSWLQSDKWLWLICSTAVSFCPLRYKWLQSLMWFKLTCIMLKQTSSTHIVTAALQDRCGKYLVSRSGEEPNVLGGGFLSIFKYITKNLSGTDLSTGKEPQCFWSRQDFAVEWSKDLSRHDILQPVIKLKRSLQRSVIHHV